MYHYLMHERWQWFFATPNMCAAFLTVCLGMLLTVLITTKHNVLKNILLGILLFGQILLSLTYSRSGFIAWSSCLLIVYRMSCRKITIILLAAFYIFILFMLPSGYLRVGSIINISDGSILHRLWLWLGGVGTIAQFPLGCPYPIGKYYELQYMPWFLNENYRNFLSDTLTIGSKYGIIALSGYWLISLIFINWLFSIWQKNKNVIASTLLGTWVSIIVNGLFSTFYFVKEILLGYIILALLIFFYIAKQIHLKKWNPDIKNYLIPLISVVIITAGIFFVGKLVNKRLLYRVILHKDEYQCKFISKQPKEKVLYFFSDNHVLGTSDFFPDVRKWAIKGIDTYLFKIDDGVDGLNKIKFELANHSKNSDKKLVIVGTGIASSNVLIAAIQSHVQGSISKILLYNCSAQSPLKNLSAINFINNLETPLIFLYDNEARQYDSQLLINAVKNKNRKYCRFYYLKYENQITDIIFNLINRGND